MNEAALGIFPADLWAYLGYRIEPTPEPPAPDHAETNARLSDALRMMTEKFDQADQKRAYWKAKAEAHGSCSCNIGPGLDGPDECCPEHGRTYFEWIERGDILQKRLAEREEEVVRLTAQLARLIPERRTRNAYDERVNEISWVTPWEPAPSSTPECCASGRCEVCSAGFKWERDG